MNQGRLGDKMGSSHDQKRRNEEFDRLSSLPDDIIHKILSFVGIKDAINTSALSPRWRFIWTSTPYLDFSSEDFPKLPEFSKFVTNVLSHRNNQIDVYSVKLSFRGKASQAFVKKIIDYAFSHNVQQLNVECLVDSNIEFRLSRFSSRSLKHLSLTKRRVYLARSSWKISSSSLIITTSTWEFPALTTLYLNGVTFCSDDDNTDNCIGVFSKCVNLKNLTLESCETEGLNCFSICHPRLSNFTLLYGLDYVKVVNVVAPKLENMIIRSFWTQKQVISAPCLASVVFECRLPLEVISTDGFHSLEKADICISEPDGAHADKIVSLIEQFHNIKFLKLNMEIVELFSSNEELISHQPSPFANLKSLTIYPKHVYVSKSDKIIMSTKVNSYLLDSSPEATFTLVSREYIIAVKNATSAQDLMSELQELLEEEKANTETSMADQDAQVENQIEETMTQVYNCWEDLIEQWKETTGDIVSRLHDIKKILTKLPTSKRATIQPCFSSLCVEADIVIKQLTDRMKIQCDENRSLLSVCFHELAST